MRIIVITCCFVLFLIASVVAAQRSSDIDKPVWTIESIKAKPGMFGSAMSYLDDNWMAVREEAKRRGVVLGYQRLVQQDSLDPSGEYRNIVLITEFKDQQAYRTSSHLFASIQQGLSKNDPGVLRPSRQEDVYDTAGTRVFLDYNETSGVQQRLLSVIR